MLFSAAVKLRHAAALALVGWYLMTAPRTSDTPPLAFDLSAPLNRWKTVGSYDTAAECNKAKTSGPDMMMIAKAMESMNADQKKLWTLTVFNMLAAELCIASDDPRLK